MLFRSERLALALARDPDRLAALKQRLRENRAHMPLFDTERFAKNIETGYRQAYRRWFEGEPAEDISVKDPGLDNVAAALKTLA